MEPIELRRHSGDLRAFGEVRLVTLDNGPGRGQQLLLCRNASGLELEIAVTRGFDISALRFRSFPLGWHSPVGFSGPSAYELESGFGMLRSLDGFLVTCGLDHHGEPAEGPAQHFNYPARASIQYPLHGRISGQAATLIGHGLDASRLGESSEAVIWCEAEVRQAAVFGETLVLRRRIEIDLFASRIRLRDVVTNEGFRPTRHAMLYHLNMGFPLLDRNAQPVGELSALRSNFDSAPPVPDDDAREICDTLNPEGDADGLVTMGLHNPSLCGGLTVRVEYSKTQLPRCDVWRCWQSGIYVFGIEPRTDPGSDSLRYAGPDSPCFLEAGAARRYELTIDVLERPNC